MVDGGTILELDAAREGAYEEFLEGCPDALFYASNAYRKLLKGLLGDEDHYLLALDGQGRIRGALPAFLRRNDRHGPVLNSLPFYGSNGGVLGAGDPVRSRLLDAFFRLAERERCVSATVITSPLEPEVDAYRRQIRPTFEDRRIGQLVFLPGPGPDLAGRLLAMFHVKTRNMVRKAQKEGLEILCRAEPGDFAFLHATHTENMAELGGLGKPRGFFEGIRTGLREGREFRLYLALAEGVCVAALLLFYFNGTAEYYTPVIKKAYRSRQPMTLLIFQAMRDAVEMGCSRWNWGGTWASQEGVYHFKKRWGTRDLEYRYFTKILDPSILQVAPATLLEQYPNYFVLPFRELAPVT